MSATTRRRSVPDQLHRDRVVAWSLLLLAGIITASLWIGSEDVAKTLRRRVGNGTGYYTDVDRTIRTELVVASLVAGVAGLTGWAFLMARHEPSTSRRAAMVTVAVVGCAVLAGIASGRIFRGDPYQGQPRLDSTVAVANALERAELVCARLTPVDAGSLWEESSTCPIPSGAALADGHDDVFIGIFADDDARDAWLASHSPETVYAVTGPTWVTTCEFQGTCAQIQHAVGGRSH